MKIAAIALAASAITLPALGQEAPLPDRQLFILGGVMTSGDMGETLDPFTVSYENAFVIGGGYQQFFAEPLDKLRIGLEVGGALRTGDGQATGELWGGVVTRYDGLTFGEHGLRISPSLTFGVSVVDDTMGTEARREAHDGLPGNVLFYLSPEISISSADNPNTEMFWRLHHRSGAWNSFGGGGSANATTIGFRTGF